MFENIKSNIARLINEALTNKVGLFEPVRVVGIPSFILGVLVYLGASIYTVFKTGTLDWVQWSAGFTALMTSLIALSAALRVKESTEMQPPAHDEKRPVPPDHPPVN